MTSGNDEQGKSSAEYGYDGDYRCQILEMEVEYFTEQQRTDHQDHKSGRQAQ